VGAEQRRDESDRLAHVEQLNREIVQLEGEVEQLDVQVADLQRAIDHHRVRAPVAGVVGELADVRLGAIVEEGERLAAVVPSGDLQIVAEFTAPDAVGRIATGQSARMRLHGFPWTQYGTLGATVEKVATEAHDGRIRVELEVDADEPADIPLQHGLPGTVEVEVEAVSPLTLVLRAAGRLLTQSSENVAAGGHG
jgi:membrane fusion protein (multidrug efflux system)